MQRKINKIEVNFTINQNILLLFSSSLGPSPLFGPIFEHAKLDIISFLHPDGSNKLKFAIIPIEPLPVIHGPSVMISTPQPTYTNQSSVLLDFSTPTTLSQEEPLILILLRRRAFTEISTLKNEALTVMSKMRIKNTFTIVR